MPYIAQKDRPALDQHIDALAAEIKKTAAEYGYDGAFAGLLNYTCTTLALKVIPARRYWVIAILSGVFHNIADEFYRKYAAKYEDEQIVKNGDVY
jgi:hypothetical protein